MLEINDGYNKLKFSIDNYINKKYRKFNKLDEDDCWCNLYISIENEYVKIDNPYYDLECIEVDNLYEVLNEFINDKMESNYSYEPIEPSFKIYFYPYGEEYQNNNYEQENISRKDKVARIFIAFIEKDTKAPSSDGVYIVLDIDAISEILNYLENTIKSKKRSQI